MWYHLLTWNKMSIHGFSFHPELLPPSFNNFLFLSSSGVAGGSAIIWRGDRFKGLLEFQNDFIQCVKFKPLLSVLTGFLAMYMPLQPIKLNWFSSFELKDDEDYLLMGDFNLIRCLPDRNKLGGCIQEILHFNNAINTLSMEEFPFIGSRFTWNNSQSSPLVERLD